MLEVSEKLIIEDAAMQAAAKLQGQPEHIAHLAANLALYLPCHLRVTLSADIAAIDTLTKH